ncbi:glycosyltransferase family 2 protein [Klebsiella pneumoniae]|nr:glycosyl transferase family 2 [Klebsiella pneumoniae]PIK02965.1 glycosyltransferase family 2 protein [Klebsiella pneumoniae]
MRGNVFMLQKKIDVILASYNGEKYIKEQIHSILICLDKVKNYECRLLIADDGSSDKTIHIVKGINDDRLRIIDSSRVGGVLPNFERLIKYSDADYVFFSDQDDVWLEDKISIFVDKFLALEIEYKKIPILLYSDVILVDSKLDKIYDSMMDSQKIIKEPTFCELLVSNSVTGCAMAVNRELLNKMDRLKNDNIIMHDWYLALIAKSIGRLCFIPGNHVLYRQHGYNQVGSKTYRISDKISPRALLSFVKRSRGDILRTIKQASYLKEQFGKELLSHDEKNLTCYIDAEKTFYKRLKNIASGRFNKMGMARNIIFIFIYLTL